MTENETLTWRRARDCSADGCIEVAWHKAAESVANGGCVEIGSGTESCGYVHLRDSHDPSTVVDVPAADMSVFLKAIKSGEFDRLI